MEIGGTKTGAPGQAYLEESGGRSCDGRVVQAEPAGPFEKSQVGQWQEIRGSTKGTGVIQYPGGERDGRRVPLGGHGIG
jgi:hypothetical protein